MMPPRPSIAEVGRSVRVLAYWGAGVGVGLLALLAFVVGSTYILFTRGDQLSGPSDGSMFGGGEVFFTWLLGNLAAGFGILVLGVAALVLDIIVLVKLSRLRGYGVRRETTRALTIAVVAGMGLVSTPVGAVLMFLPVMIFGAGQTTDTLLIVIVAAMFVVPVVGRIAQTICAQRLPRTLRSERPLPGYPQPAPGAPQN